jgi:membrane associated rhomboid family serine protease
VFLTPALVGLNAGIFVFMLVDAGALSSPETLVGWGGNFGPRTTNGEWWRLVTMMFVHSGLLHLLANVAGLVQLGFILERLVGRVAFAAVYVTSGALAGLVSLSTHPMAVSVGASGAIFGIYGLLLALWLWGRLHRSTVTIPLMVVRWLGPAATVFILFNVVTDRLDSSAELTGLVTGFVCGLILASGVSDRKPTVLRIAAATAAAIVIVMVSVVPLRGVTDVRPEIERIVAVEDRTASAYETEVNLFKKGRTTAKALAEVIHQTIMPELQAARVRLKALDGVPHEQEPLVAGAEEYLRLRDESWRLRTEGLHKSDMLLLRKAESPERAALEALQKIRPADQQ